eukprot:TRINITY_DN7624_c0_g1_i1.p1 TRINITY_DN7624_c0_g1~~TRINITY_DN7624_c0_g1_i1.p1  ORF type:complete len:130 (-),score=11.21 TRINITY_DN7624_c0_g1_i1:31-420(-)
MLRINHGTRPLEENIELIWSYAKVLIEKHIIRRLPDLDVVHLLEYNQKSHLRDMKRRYQNIYFHIKKNKFQAKEIAAFRLENGTQVSLVHGNELAPEYLLPHKEEQIPSERNCSISIGKWHSGIFGAWK